MSIARIIVIGNEVLSGEVQDENIHFLAGRLTRLGTRVGAILVVPDEDEIIAESIRAGLASGARVLVTGGIGPTHDDRTRGAVALSLDLPLESHAEAEQHLRASYGPEITGAELSMALLPRGARLVFGERYGVFGFVIDDVYVFPGVPGLLRDIFEAIAPEFSGTPDHRVEIVSPRKEGDFADELTALQAAFPDVSIGSYPTFGKKTWSVRLIFRGRDPARVHEAATLARRIAGVGDAV